MLAKSANDNADILDERGALETFASMPAPTVARSARIHLRVLHVCSVNQGPLCRVVSPPSYPASG